MHHNFLIVSSVMRVGGGGEGVGKIKMANVGYCISDRSDRYFLCSNFGIVLYSIYFLFRYVQQANRQCLLIIGKI
jgi:hypothetical protein